ncbi:hypothetical protein KL937_004879 [Ogataea polymorpha]|nr:hypothetical protein KL937_004879 [Ogataea polymorpha]KAG7894351.1 hypothetical protein KL908_001723 [Ogataea polymorpha]KAG7931854.1 hypothetical protein KL904_004895 [Ogataea polymorpha]
MSYKTERVGSGDESDKEVFSDTPGHSVPTTAELSNFGVTNSPRTAGGSPFRSWSRDASARRERRAARLQSIEILRAKLAGSPNASSEEEQQEQLDIDKTLNILPVPNFTIRSTWRGTNDVPPGKHTNNIGTSASEFNEIDSLQKQLTDCKIQLRLQKELLLERYGEESSAMEFLKRQFENSDDHRETEHLRKQFDDLVKAFEELQSQLEVLQRDHQDWKSMADQILDVIDEAGGDTPVVERARKGGLSAKLRAVGLETERLAQKINSSRGQEFVEISGKDSIIKGTEHDETLLERLDELETKIHQLADEKLQVEKRSSELEKENNRLKDELQKLNLLEEENRTLKDMESKFEELKIQKSQPDERILAMEARLKDYEGLQAIYEDTKSKFDVLLEEKENIQMQLSEAQRQLQAIDDREIDPDKTSPEELKEYVAKLETDLNSALVKQRQLNSEKIKLNYQIDELKSLIRSHEENALYAEQKWQDYLTSDVNFQTHLIQILSEILDKQSIREAAAKILQLANRDELQLNETDTKKLYETIFEYDLAAVRTIVADHAELSKKASTDHAPVADESLKLRIEELTKRWKHAEETLAFERKQSEKRLQELERENKKLRQ